MSRTAASATARRAPWLRRGLAAVVVLVLLWLLTGAIAAWIATGPRPAPIAPRAGIAGTAVTEVATTAADGVVVRGWLCTADPTRCVLLAAGIRGNRGSLIGPAEFWLRRGWSVLLVDLRGTGTSTPTPIAFGWHEATDLLAWCALLRGRGVGRIGAHGHSLGAAAIVYASARGVAWDFVVLEACYDDIRTATRNRAPAWLPLPDLCLWPMTLTAQLRLHIDPEQLRPIALVPRMTMPALLLCGDADPRVRPAESAALLRAFGSPRKELRWIAGAGHVDLWRYDAAACAAALTEFAAGL